MTDEQAPNQDPVVIDSAEQAEITKRFFDKFLEGRDFTKWEYDAGYDNSSIPTWVRKREAWITPVEDSTLDTLIVSQSQKYKTADRKRDPNIEKIGGIEEETLYGLIAARDASHDPATGKYHINGGAHTSFSPVSWASRGGTLIVPEPKLSHPPEIQLPFNDYLNGLLNTRLEPEISAIQSGNWKGDFYAIPQLVWNEVMKIYDEAVTSEQVVVGD